MQMTESAIRVHICTWNVAETQPPSDQLSLLGLDGESKFDVVAVGLQEIPSYPNDLFWNMMVYDKWTASISTILNKHQYTRIKAVRMMGLVLVVFVLRKHLPHLGCLEARHTMTGWAGLLGGKGAVGVRLDLCGVSLCFINSHLAAHLQNNMTRLSDYQYILKCLQFSQGRQTILDHDYVFWFGDLNFRLDEVSNSVVRTLIAEEKWLQLQDFDQLSIAIKAQQCFVDFLEGPLSFAPTYKFDRGTDVYDSSVKKRKPAWCDRILWHVHRNTSSKFDLSTQQHTYKSIGDKVLWQSDHRPVVADFTLRVQNPPYISAFVEFQHKSVWSPTDDGICELFTSQIVNDCATHWVAMYEAEPDSLDAYTMWMWLPLEYENLSDGRRKYHLIFDKLYLPHNPGKYLIGFHSGVDYSLLCLSAAIVLLSPNEIVQS